MAKYCVACGFALKQGQDFASVCIGCIGFSTKSLDFLKTYVPAVCGDDVCYLDEEGMPNLDGECSHSKDFDQVFDQL